MVPSHPLLQQYKAQEQSRRNAGVLLVTDPRLMSIALAWSATTVTLQVPDRVMAPDELWDWLCDTCDFDDTQLAIASGVSDIGDLEIHLTKLFRHRLIYPDGTIAHVVTEVADMQLLPAVTPKGLK